MSGDSRIRKWTAEQPQGSSSTYEMARHWKAQSAGRCAWCLATSYSDELPWDCSAVQHALSWPLLAIRYVLRKAGPCYADRNSDALSSAPPVCYCKDWTHLACPDRMACSKDLRGGHQSHPGDAGREGQCSWAQVQIGIDGLLISCWSTLLMIWACHAILRMHAASGCHTLKAWTDQAAAEDMSFIAVKPS